MPILIVERNQAGIDLQITMPFSSFMFEFEAGSLISLIWYSDETGSVSKPAWCSTIKEESLL